MTMDLHASLTTESSFFASPLHYVLSIIMIILNTIVVVLSVLSFSKNYTEGTLERLGALIIVSIGLAGVSGIQLYCADILMFTGYNMERSLRLILFVIQYPLVAFGNGLIIASFFSAAVVGISANWVSVLRRVLIGVSSITILVLFLGVGQTYLLEVQYDSSLEFLRAIIGTFYILVDLLFCAMMVVALVKIPKRKHTLTGLILKRVIVGVYLVFAIELMMIPATVGTVAFNYVMYLVYLTHLVMCFWCLYFTRPNRYHSSVNSERVVASSKSKNSVIMN
eukprot:TRINITY_DN1705_c0_g1_i2.p1 TRINITY_DN1705_c0_g1~~TRINITY_DN1705_c0_g1_i2.p1  ORF type:complete len:280 (-),score=22.22 TRINITY_DN1705_c0_g1_i2:26-865(-)